MIYCSWKEKKKKKQPPGCQGPQADTRSHTKPQAQGTSVPGNVDRRKPSHETKRQRPPSGLFVTSCLLVPAEASDVLAFSEELASLGKPMWDWGLPVNFRPQPQLQLSWGPS